MKNYEIMYIIRPNLSAEEIAAVVKDVNAIFTDNDSKVLEVKEWGLRDLAYQINHFKKGYYVWAHVSATPTAVFEFDRKVGYNEQIIRHICVKDEE